MKLLVCGPGDEVAVDKDNTHVTMFCPRRTLDVGKATLRSNQQEALFSDD